jgi:hypothetical protein
MKIRPLGAESFHEDRQTDMKLAVAFHNFSNAPNKRSYFMRDNSTALAIFHNDCIMRYIR